MDGKRCDLRRSSFPKPVDLGHQLRFGLIAVGNSDRVRLPVPSARPFQDLFGTAVGDLGAGLAACPAALAAAQLRRLSLPGGLAL